MTDTFAIQTPIREKRWVELSDGSGKHLFRKQVLPMRSINYKGRKIEFTPQYLADLAASFNDRAFDQVPVQFAGADNAHTLDPDRTRGEVQRFEVTPDGLDAVLELSDAGAEVVRANPKLGISARIVEGLERADGKVFGRAIQHVLATLDPRVTGLKPWEAIALSNSDLQVIDLSGESYEKKGATVPDDPKTPKIDDAQRAAFDAYVTELASLDPAKGGGAAGDDDAAAKAAADQAAIDAELDALLGDVLAADGASLSNDADGIDLVNAQLTSQRQQLDDLNAQLDLSNYEKEKAELIGQGIPPAMVDLAMPLLLGKDHTIDLSNGTSVDAGEVVRKLLAECKGLVDLSSATPASPASPATDKTNEALDAWEKQFPSVISAKS